MRTSSFSTNKIVPVKCRRQFSILMTQGANVKTVDLSVRRTNELQKSYKSPAIDARVVVKIDCVLSRYGKLPELHQQLHPSSILSRSTWELIKKILLMVLLEQTIQFMCCGTKPKILGTPSRS